MKADERVKALLQAGKINRDEADRLLAAMAITRRPDRWQLLLYPFQRLTPPVSLAFAGLIAALGLGLSRWAIRFDGFLDLHKVTTAPSLRTSFVEQVLVWPAPALLFWIYALAFRRRTRLIDFIAMMGLSRLPLVLAAIVCAALIPSPPRLTIGSYIAAGFAIAAIAWMLTLLFQGFKHASGLRGAPLGLGYVALIVLSEVVSKVVLALV